MAVIGAQAPAGGVRMLRRLLPEGGGLAPDVWRARHRGILVLLWAHAVAVPIFGLLRGFSLRYMVLESAIVPATALIAGGGSLGRAARTAAASAGLLSSSAILVHLSGGVIEMHFHFFVMVAVVALYQAWLPFLAAIAYVLVHHGLMGALDPNSVYNHAAAQNGPWKWAAIHAFFIAGTSATCLVTWRLNEMILAQRLRTDDERTAVRRRASRALRRGGSPSEAVPARGGEHGAHVVPRGHRHPARRRAPDRACTGGLLRD